jgi:hypothetical protein
MAEETDADVLEQLHNYADWPRDLDELAQEAAVRGRLREAYHRALNATTPEAAGSSQSSATIQAARVPDLYSHLPNWSRTFFSQLRRELEGVLGIEPRVKLFDDV